MRRRPPKEGRAPRANALPILIPADDQELAALARRYRRESIATLIAIARNPRAPASARAHAAAKVLEYSDGRPRASQQITVADLPRMTADQRDELLSALLFQYEAKLPGEFERRLRRAATKLLEKQLLREAATPKWPPSDPVRHADQDHATGAGGAGCGFARNRANRRGTRTGHARYGATAGATAAIAAPRRQ